MLNAVGLKDVFGRRVQMTSAIKRWFQDIIIERAKRLLWANVAAEIEADAVLDYVAQIDRIEEQAAAYEAEGKTHPAEMLRERAAQISFENPAGAGERVIQSLASRQGEIPRIPHQEGSVGSAPTADKPRRGRPPKQPAAQGTGTSQENTELDTGYSGRNEREGTFLR